jgi:exopolysaccharide biosynthesis polyprenyl glycosylphosphotransferase
LAIWFLEGANAAPLSAHDPLAAGAAACFCAQFAEFDHIGAVVSVRKVDIRDRIIHLRRDPDPGWIESSPSASGLGVDTWRSSGNCDHAPGLGERIFVECTRSMSVTKSVSRANFLQLRVGERRALLVIGDFIAGLVALLAALYLWGTSERFTGFSQEFIQKRVPFWFFLLPLIWVVLMVELYDVHRAADWRRTVRGVAVALVIGMVLYLVLYFYYVAPPNSLLPRRGVATYLVTVSLLTLLWRWVYIRVFTAPQFMRRVLLVGGGRSGELLLKIFNRLDVKPFMLVGIVDDDAQKQGTSIEGYPVIGTSEQILMLVEEHQVSDIIVAVTGEMRGKMFQALLDAQEQGVEIVRMPKVYEALLGRVPILYLEANWILRSFVDETNVSSFYLLVKRLLDILGGLLGTLAMVLLLPFIALATLLDDGWPIFYAQTRLGRGAQAYQIIKFRTMRRDAEPDGKPRWAREDDERATRVGKFLRRTHIDELPQFINVLRGDMSLVGPRAERPELVEYFQKHIPFYRARLLVKPGITGWAQVNFGYAATIDETITKLEYDLYYIKRRNLMMDLIILLRTPATVLGLRGR